MQTLEAELKTAQKTKDTEIQKVTNYYTAALDTVKMKLEDEKINAVKEVEMRSQMREEYFKNQTAEFAFKEAQYIKGEGIFFIIFLTLFFSFFLSIIFILRDRVLFCCDVSINACCFNLVSLTYFSTQL